MTVRPRRGYARRTVGAPIVPGIERTIPRSRKIALYAAMWSLTLVVCAVLALGYFVNGDDPHPNALANRLIAETLATVVGPLVR